MLDTALTDKLIAEGQAREFVNRIQKTRKDLNLEFTDRISVTAITTDALASSLKNEQEYICRETLCDKLTLQVAPVPSSQAGFLSEEINEIPCLIQVIKVI